MWVEDVPLYNAWDLEAPKLPKRSHLYSLQPIGIGTPIVESLTSYLSRLAESHKIALCSLIQYEITPWFLIYSQLPQRSRVDAWELSLAIWQRNPKLLQENTAEEWLAAGQRVNRIVRALETLTLRQDLAGLTLLPWRQLFSLDHAFHIEPFWCPMCYQQWQESGAIYGEPLMWSLEGVDVCPQHHCYLQFWCLYCRRPQPFLRLDSRLGYCSSCGAWLGRTVQPTVFRAEDLQKERWLFWCAEAMGQLLSMVPLLQVSSSTLSPRKQRKPRLLAFLKWCYKLGVSCVEGLNLLSGSIDGIQLCLPGFESIK